MAPTTVVAGGLPTDAPHESRLRFPDSRESWVAGQVRATFAGWQVGTDTTVVSGGDRGTDLIAAEQALALGAQVTLCLPDPVSQCRVRLGDGPHPAWAERLDRVTAHPDTTVAVLPRGSGRSLLGRRDRPARSMDHRLDVAGRLGASAGVLVWDGHHGPDEDAVQRLRSWCAAAATAAVIDPTPRRYEERQRAPGPKRILTVDGGGIRGVLSLEVLAAIESQLRAVQGRDDLVLSDYFDYLAGTSTGAVIAAALALGHPVTQIRQRYVALGRKVFRKRLLVSWLHSLYGDRALARELDDFFGADRTLGDAQFRSLLLMVLHNTETDSPWPVTNCTTAKYNGSDRLLRPRPDRNLDLPLTPLVRASTAAPFYFPPQWVAAGSKGFLFQDGGLTPFNNPALLAAVMATAPAYRLGWAAGADQLLVVSVGTGNAGAVHPGLRARGVHALFNARNLPSVFMNGAAFGQDMLCRTLGSCRFGPQVDRELGDLTGQGPPAGAAPLFSYVRYTADLSDAALRRAGVDSAAQRAAIRGLDAVEQVPLLQRLGRQVAQQVDVTEHFRGFW